VTVTEKHPMLVVNTYGLARQVLARDVVHGDRLPIHCSSPLSDEIAADTLAHLARGSSRKRLETSIIKSHFAKTRQALKSCGSLMTAQVESVEITKVEQPSPVYSIDVE